MESTNLKDLVKVASMYYDEGMTQARIANIKGVSRSLISKMLIEAKKKGIVNVIINSADKYTVDLERELEKKYKLHNAIVVDTFDIKKEEVSKMVSQQAALYLSKIIINYEKIGISWGNSLFRLVDNFPFTLHSNASVIPLIGGLSDDEFEIQSNQLCFQLARKLRGRAKYLYTPALISNVDIREELVNNQAIQSILTEGSTVDLALVGISSIDTEINMQRVGLLHDSDIDNLKEHNAVGVINSHFFDINGEELEHPINSSVIGVNIYQLKKIPVVYTIVQDIEKSNALRVALQTGVINGVILTDKVAEHLLTESE